jgi:hypothetical protein
MHVQGECTATKIDLGLSVWCFPHACSSSSCDASAFLTCHDKPLVIKTTCMCHFNDLLLSNSAAYTHGQFVTYALHLTAVLHQRPAVPLGSTAASHSHHLLFDITACLNAMLQSCTKGLQSPPGSTKASDCKDPPPPRLLLQQRGSQPVPGQSLRNKGAHGKPLQFFRHCFLCSKRIVQGIRCC